MIVTARRSDGGIRTVQLAPSLICDDPVILAHDDLVHVTAENGGIRISRAMIQAAGKDEVIAAVITHALTPAVIADWASQYGSADSLFPIGSTI